MTTYDPRSRDVASPTSRGDDGGREPTESLSLVPDGQDSPAELAVGTHNRPVTRIAPPSHRPEDPDDYLGAVLGSYRVVELLGKGGMGYVFRAEHVKLGREVALKLLRSDYASRRDAVARFFQEARTVNRVRHRNIVDVTDFVELDDGTTYIVMELLSGTSLGAWAASGVDLPRALAVLVQICDGLGAAHQVGVVHRDLKPDNVIVVPTSDGAELVKLLDFGVAKLLNRDDEDVGFQTAAGSVIGTPAYMSPEQAGGMVVDARSDIYSLGAIMYELFTGEPMFRGRSFGEYVRKHLTETPVPPSQTAGGAAIDPRLEALILRCLDKDPDQRFALIAELREALLHLLGGTGSFPERLDSGLRSQIGPGVTGSQPPQLLGAISYPPQPRTAAAPWWPWLAGGGAAIGVGIAAAIWYAGGGDAPAPPPKPASRAPAAPAAVPAPPTPAAIAPPPPARPQLVEVRFDAQPGGSVFAEGRPAELCRTPCAFEIDRSDGGPADHRVFVIRRTGYVDSPITVDLAGDQREFHAVLQRGAPGKADTADRRPGKRPGKPPKKDRAARAPGNAGEADVAARPGKPAEVTPPATRPPPTTISPPAVAPIDPADTLDPFRKK
jgi:serine/threonine-protein kinase